MLKCICSFCVAVSRSCVVRKAVSSANVAVVLSAVVSQLCSVGREVGPGRCPVAHQIESGEGMYEGNSINKLQIQVATYVFELNAGNCHRLIAALSSFIVTHNDRYAHDLQT